MDSFRLGIDFGTSSTVAALAGPDGRVRPLLFDSSPLLSSAVFLGPDGAPLTGADAERAGLAYASGLEPNPKRRIDDGTLWLGEREVRVVDLIGVVLRRVAEEAYRVTGRSPSGVVITHPAAWRQSRLGSLASAASAAGLGDVRFVPEPVAAAAYFVRVLGHALPVDRCLVVYDFGAGTFDVSVVRPVGPGFEVVASAGLPDVGGLDLDAAVVAHARALTGGATDAWARLDWPQSPADQQARHALWRSAKAAKEQLSRHPAADLHVPLAGADVRVTREEFEKLATPLLDRTSSLTLSVLREGGVAPEQVGGVFLVGGSSRIPLAATLLHRTLRIAPTALDYPELVVAEGSLHAIGAVPTAPGQPGSAPAFGGPPTPGAQPGSPHAVPPAPSPPGPRSASGPWGTAPAPPERRPTRKIALVAGSVAAVVLLALVAALVVLKPWVDDGPVTGATKGPTLTGHTDDVTAVAVGGPDGTLAAGASDDDTIRFWNVESGKKDGPDLTGFTIAPDEIEFNPDGSRLLTLSGSTVQLWDTGNRRNAFDTIEELDTEKGLQSPGSIADVAFVNDGKQVQAAFSYGSVLTWNTSDGKRVGTYPTIAGADKLFSDVALSPDGTRLATVASKEGLRVYDVKKKSLVGGELKTADDISSFDNLTFSPDGTRLAVTNSYDVVVFDVGSGKVVDTFEGHTGSIDTLAFSPDGKVLASAGNDNRILLWDLANHRELTTALTGHQKKTGDTTNSITGLAFSQDGNYLGSSSTDKTVILWKMTRD
ncbi:molecular chaperone [Cryptosporangium arvum DSM 44712]|uniref:Molecular chaperone n=1 Tax=Cryptosporangium arvum DSM 44712 TaxID=927661 RepID=A0A010YKZ6_9ACTN|nr:molecular chaperone [Cryptosporangium arvum DSM 44712]